MDAEGDVKPWNKAELEKFHHFPASAFEAEELSEVAERQSDHSGASFYTVQCVQLMINLFHPFPTCYID